MQRAEAVREEPKSPQATTTLPFPSPPIYLPSHFKNLASKRERTRMRKQQLSDELPLLRLLSSHAEYEFPFPRLNTAVGAHTAPPAPRQPVHSSHSQPPH